MPKTIASRFLTFLVLALLLMACSPAGETAAPAAPPTEQEREETAAKPQFIKFYAEW
jgi:hypothetical protein